MKICDGIDISIIEELIPLPYEVNIITPQTKTFLFLLLHDNYFLDLLSKIRKDLSLPQEGLTLNDLFNVSECKRFLIADIDKKKLARLYHLIRLNKKDKEFYGLLNSFSDKELSLIMKRFKNKHVIPKTLEGNSIFLLSKKSKDDLNKLVNHYHLPESAKYDLMLLIIFNTFKNFERKKELFATDNKDELISSIGNNKFVALVVHENMSMNEMVQWVKTNWITYIADKVNALPKIPDSYSNNLEVAEEIQRLYEKYGSYSDVSTELTDIYPDNDKVTDADWIKETLFRYKKRLDDLSK